MPHSSDYFHQLKTRYQLSNAQLKQQGFALLYENFIVKLKKLDEPKLGAIWVDFVAGAAGHRRKFGGGKGQAIAKAVGLKAGKLPRVLDATAGLGRDAFVLASLGCHVTLMERSPVVAALLDDGLQRAMLNSEIGAWVAERMQLLNETSIKGIELVSPAPEVIYLDPMFPHKKGKALVKKEMRVFQTLVGCDIDADQLLKPALACATERVVVKRPDYAPPLDGVAPTMAINTKKNRFDVYVMKALNLS